MNTAESVVSAGVDLCERHGYEVDRPARSWLPEAIATRDEDAETQPLFGDERLPVAIEPLDVDDVEPTTVISRLWNNSTNDRRTLFVVPGDDADALSTTVVGILSTPTCAHAAAEDGCRAFYNGPDRISVAGGGYALHKSTDPDFRWFEVPGAADSDGLLGRTGTDRRQVVLTDGDEQVAVVDGVDGLGCPPASTFPYSYRRDQRDKCFHVTDVSGREVGVFRDFRSMRAAAYEPIPMPFVPEHLFDGSVRRRWAVLVADDGGTRLYTADGRTQLE